MDARQDSKTMGKVSHFETCPNVIFCVTSTVSHLIRRDWVQEKYVSGCKAQKYE